MRQFKELNDAPSASSHPSRVMSSMAAQLHPVLVGLLAGASLVLPSVAQTCHTLLQSPNPAPAGGFGEQVVASGANLVILETNAQQGRALHFFHWSTASGAYSHEGFTSVGMAPLSSQQIAIQGDVLAFADDLRLQVWRRTPLFWLLDASFQFSSPITAVDVNGSTIVAATDAPLNPRTHLLRYSAASGSWSIQTTEWLIHGIGRIRDVAALPNDGLLIGEDFFSPTTSTLLSIGLSVPSTALGTATRIAARDESSLAIADGTEVRVLERQSGGQWSVAGYLTPGLGFGSPSAVADISFIGNRLVATIGAPLLSRWFRYDAVADSWFFEGGLGASLLGDGLGNSSALTIDRVICGAPTYNSGSGAVVIRDFQCDSQGEEYCRASPPNSSGGTTLVEARGSASVSLNSLRLDAVGLPAGSACYFLTSLGSGLTFQPPNSQGVLCLGGQIGRFSGPGQILNSGSTGLVSLQLNLASIPAPTGLVSAGVGEIRHFQLWYRDANPTSTSNFSSAVRLMFAP